MCQSKKSKYTSNTFSKISLILLNYYILLLLLYYFCIQWEEVEMRHSLRRQRPCQQALPLKDQTTTFTQHDNDGCVEYDDTDPNQCVRPHSGQNRCQIKTTADVERTSLSQGQISFQKSRKVRFFKQKQLLIHKEWRKDKQVGPYKDKKLCYVLLLLPVK